MDGLIRKLFFKDAKIKTFFVIRLLESQIQESVWLKTDKKAIDISRQHGMICLDPFCMAVWLPDEQLSLPNLQRAVIEFKKGNTATATIKLAFIEKILTTNGALLLYRIKNVKSLQSNFLQRIILFSYLFRSQKSNFYSRKVISALYSYPRSIIIISYRDENYCNIFPMDIHSYIEQEGIYILGLRTTNVTLNKIIEARKVVVCDTDSVDINTVYELGKHPSSAPTPIDRFPFDTSESEIFRFPIPDFTGSYKEIEIIQHKKMGYHMLLVGKVINFKKIKPDAASFYHLSFLQHQNSNYKSIEAVY